MKKVRALLPLLFYFPFAAGAIAPLVVALIAGAVIIAGYSVYRSLVPVDLSEGLEYFSSCWSCGIFSGILQNLSDFIPRIYKAIGTNILPISAGLVFVWFMWEKVIKNIITIQPSPDPWKITGDFTTKIIKLVFIAGLLTFPLPRFLMDTFIQPIMNVGLSYNHIARQKIEPDSDTFDACLIATAVSETTPDIGAFSPKLRNNIACQIAEFHSMTGLGITVGWTFAQMSFSADYMYHLGPVPVFPNVLLIFAGLSIMLMFLWALFPVPIYFLSVFLKLSLDLVMLPLMLLGWLFSDWGGIFPGGTIGIKRIIDDAVKNTAGIALVGLFTGFAILFLNEIIGTMDGIGALSHAIQTNDSVYLMDALMLNNDGIIDIIFAGIFIGMFMNAIPAMVERLFKNAKIPDGKNIQDAVAQTLKNAYDGISKKAKVLMAKKSAPPAPAPTPPAPATP